MSFRFPIPSLSPTIPISLTIVRPFLITLTKEAVDVIQVVVLIELMVEEFTRERQERADPDDTDVVPTEPIAPALELEELEDRTRAGSGVARGVIKPR
ncbi:hypothetical protein ONZ45_g15243 [Pleurotus djamor]|nr:hypothetical protein ONZ45_g15243 [Pleurotus djamor]